MSKLFKGAAALALAFGLSGCEEAPPIRHMDFQCSNEGREAGLEESTVISGYRRSGSFYVRSGEEADTDYVFQFYKNQFFNNAAAVAAAEEFCENGTLPNFAEIAYDEADARVAGTPTLGR